MSESVTPTSPLVAVDATPTRDQVWTPSAAFLASWGRSVAMQAAYSTDVAQSLTAAEMRRGVTGKPYRMLTVERQAFDGGEHANVLSIFNRMTAARSLVPLYQDVADLSAATAAGATVLHCDTVDRRFYAGARVLIAKPRKTNLINAYELGKISSLTSTTITLVAGTTGSYIAGDRVYPLLECQLNFEGVTSALNDYITGGTVQFKEVVGHAALPALATPGVVPGGWPTYGGVPILDLRTDWRSVTVGQSRLGNESSTGIDVYYEPRGDRSRFTAAISFTALERATAFHLLKFFDYAGGRLFPFYFVSPLSTFQYLGDGAAPNSIRVSVVGPLSDWQYVKHLGFFLNDGTYLIRGITASERATSTQDELTLDDVLPGDLADNLRSLSPAYLVRFDQDEILETWETDQVMTTDLRLVELINEKVVDLGVPPGDGDDGGTESGDPTPPGDDDPPGPIGYSQLQRCTDDTTAPLWIPTSKIVTDPTILLNPGDGECYHVSHTNATSLDPLSLGGTILPGWEVAGDCTHFPCPTPCLTTMKATIAGTVDPAEAGDSGDFPVFGLGQVKTSSESGYLTSGSPVNGKYITIFWDSGTDEWVAQVVFASGGLTSVFAEWRLDASGGPCVPLTAISGGPWVLQAGAADGWAGATFNTGEWP